MATWAQRAEETVDSLLGIAAAVDDFVKERGMTKTTTAMTLRAVRVPDDLWAAARKRADERGENLSAVLRRALEEYAAAGDE